MRGDRFGFTGTMANYCCSSASMKRGKQRPANPETTFERAALSKAAPRLATRRAPGGAICLAVGKQREK
jgi:hypothetical protein